MQVVALTKNICGSLKILFVYVYEEMTHVAVGL